MNEIIYRDRIKILNDKSITSGQYVIYWMQASQRIKWNHALNYSIKLANKYKKPLIIFFGLTDNFPEANLRHYNFMLQGLIKLSKTFEKQGLQFIIQLVSPEKGIKELAKQACFVVVDRGYLKIQKLWRKNVAENINCPLIQIESDVVVPVEKASEKEEFAARTIRPKITKKINDYFQPIHFEKLQIDSFKKIFKSIDISDIKKLYSNMKLDKTVSPVDNFTGGEQNAEILLKDFLKNKIDNYPEYKNDPNKNFTSNLSPYLHFGQISPLYITNEVNKRDSIGSSTFLEELIVRRELSINFVFYNPNYDSFNGLPEWSKNSLKKHQSDKREYVYELNDFEKAETHDSYWNAAQKQMIKTGKMHGYMRMYWGKKIIEWTKNPQDAYKIALYLNNKYELDGRDPNGYTGVAWCFGKHDRPWSNRLIFGNIRYMNANGLKRKFNIEKYVEKFGN